MTREVGNQFVEEYLSIDLQTWKQSEVLKGEDFMVRLFHCGIEYWFAFQDLFWVVSTGRAARSQGSRRGATVIKEVGERWRGCLENRLLDVIKFQKGDGYRGDVENKSGIENSASKRKGMQPKITNINKFNTFTYRERKCCNRQEIRLGSFDESPPRFRPPRVGKKWVYV
ncbi:hypothetical protein AVEN_125956-1 [Araneus ventricosus]|uniref:Uncharacterized protein n=1 Tax=Araneus ventricosus TaxID=182803 RepID=A0A4Y2GW53_ARAVE|nr:hypothetical protein AVEN_125956-1 [Araneus ventricosus]